MFMDPAFPDLVAASAAEEAYELECSSPCRPVAGTHEISQIFASLLRLLARLW